MASANAAPVFPRNRTEWLKALNELPATPDNIPAFFFAHGSPILAASEADVARMGIAAAHGGPNGPLANFLKDFGPALLAKYKPKGIVVFSAHWETLGETLVTDYGDENPLFMDYYGFGPSFYKLKFKSRGDSTMSKRLVEVLQKAGLRARTSPVTELRGPDGRGFNGTGFDHGVFVPFRIMFGDEFTEIPIVQVSIDETLDPLRNWKLGTAVESLRREGYLILSGGLTVHNLRDMGSMNPATAKETHKAFHQALLDAVVVPDAKDRKDALVALTKHHGFRACHPREEHFIPLYVAAGAGEEGKVKVLHANHAIPTFVFGL